ncbi:hypothetical protein FWH30_03005 [Microgenomates group bacterium]|nr:hypothetical protein [Microgenomates group bacterium]
MRAKSKYLLLASLIGLMLTSWVLFFRDERLILGLATLYPQLSFLPLLRQTLLTLGLNTIPTFLFGLFSATAFISYFFTLRDPSTSSPRQIKRWSLIFAAVTFLSFPALSTDIFSYMASDRVLTAHQANVWQVSPDNFPDDPFVELADWTDTTRVYGLVNQLIYTPLSFLAGDNFLLTLLLYKTVALAGFIALTFFLTTASSSSTPLATSARAILFNPLFLLEIVGNSHNDIFMIIFAIFSIHFFLKEKYFLSALMAALSIQVKLLFLVWVGLALIQLLRRQKIKPLAIFSAAFISFNALCFLIMQTSPLVFLERVLFNSTVLWQSLSQVLQQYFALNWGRVGLVILFGLILFCISVVWHKKHSASASSALFFLIYLLFFMSAYWNWYCLWLVMFLPFIANKKLFFTWQIWTLTSLFAYPLLWLSYRFFFGGFFWPILQYLWLVLPVLFALSYDKIKGYGDKKIPAPTAREKMATKMGQG